VKALVASEPLLHLWGFVGRVVVHDQMELLVRRRAVVNEFEKSNPVAQRLWVGMQMSITLPSCVFMAANRVVVPCRL
jgi:hypothetical protein